MNDVVAETSLRLSNFPVQLLPLTFQFTVRLKRSSGTLVGVDVGIGVAVLVGVRVIVGVFVGVLVGVCVGAGVGVEPVRVIHQQMVLNVSQLAPSRLNSKGSHEPYVPFSLSVGLIYGRSSVGNEFPDRS